MPEKEKEMDIVDKMEEALKTWDGTWKWCISVDNSTEGKTFGWYDTEDEALKEMRKIIKEIQSEHKNCQTKYCGKDKAFVFTKEKEDSDLYSLSVGQRRSCFENI